MTLTERICCKTCDLLRDSSPKFSLVEPLLVSNNNTDSHILAHVNMVCPDDRSAKLGTFISEQILGAYQYVTVIKVK